MDIKRLLLIGLLGVVVLLRLPPPKVSSAQQAFDGLDMLVAIDVSGSMYNDFSSNQQASQDPKTIDGSSTQGDSEMYRLTNSGLTHTATDPNGLRFETVSFVLDFLARTANADGFAVNANVLAFSNSPVSLSPGWVNIGQAWNDTPGQTTATAQATDAGFDIFKLSDPDKGQSGYRNSNIDKLYTMANQQFSSLPKNSHKKVLVIITDSSQCDPAGSSNLTCMSPKTTGSALASIIRENSPRDVEQLVFYLQPNNTNTQGGGSGNTLTNTIADFDNVANAWKTVQDTADSTIQGSVQVLGSIGDLPSDLFAAMVGEIAAVRGIATNDFKQLGIGEISGGTITVPAFQSELSVIAFVSSSATDTALQIQGPSGNPPPKPLDTEGRFTSSTGRLRLFRFANPVPGVWTIIGSGGAPKAWASFTPTTATLQSAPPTVLQYQPFKIKYQLLDSNQQPVLNSTVMPNFTLNLIQDGQLHSLNMHTAGTAYLSDVYYPVSTSPITVNFNVDPGDGLTSAFTDFKFLNPAKSLGDLQPQPVSFNYAFGSPDQINAAKTTGNTITIPRSETLPIVMSMSQQQIPKEAAITLTLHDIPNATPDNKCPSSGDQHMEVDQQLTTAKANLSFDNAGECIATLKVTLKNVNAQPLENQETVVFPETQIGRVKITTTRRLDLHLLDEQSNPISTTSLTPDSPPQFTMDDLIPWPPTFGQNGQIVSYPPVVMPIQAVFTNAESPTQQAWPLFTSDNTTIPTEGDCQQSTAPIPLSLAITTVNGDGTNEAQRLHLMWCKSASAGFYTAKIYGLAPGKYDITVNINQDPKLDLQHNEYSKQLADPGFAVKARLNVNRNILVVGQEGGALALLAIVALTIGWRVRSTVITSRSHVRGDLALIMETTRLDVKPPVTQRDILWQGRPPRHVTSYHFPATEFIIDELISYFPIAELSISTRNQTAVSRREAGYVTLVKGNTTLLDGKLMEPNEPYEELEEQILPGKVGTRKFFLAKLKADQEL